MLERRPDHRRTLNGAKFQAARLAAGITVAELAVIICCSTKRIYQIESAAASYLNPLLLKAIAELFDTTVDNICNPPKQWVDR